MKASRIENTLFYMSYFLFMLYAFFGTISSFAQPLKLLTNISMAVILFAFILQLKKYKLNELIKVLVLLFLSFIFIFISNNYLLLKLMLIVLISKNIDINKKISYDIKLRIFFMLIMILLFNLGIAEDTIAYYNGKIRHSIGFSNPNVLGLHTFILCLELLYINRNRLSIPKVLIYTAIMLVSNIYSGSRTALYLYFISTFLFYLYKHNKKIFSNSLIKKLIIYSPIITSLIIFLSYSFYINNFSIGISLDKIMSGRLYNINFFANKYDLTLFGTDISVANKSCDTAIVYMLFAFGYVGCMLYLLGFTKLFKVLYSKNKIGIVIIMFAFILYGMSEKLWLFADCNLLITSISYLIYEYNKGDTDE